MARAVVLVAGQFTNDTFADFGEPKGPDDDD